MNTGTWSASAADDQLAVQLVVELLLLLFPHGHGLGFENVGELRLPMADQSQPGPARGQLDRPARCSRLGTGMICSCDDWQIGEDAAGGGLMCLRWRKQADKAEDRSGDVNRALRDRNA